MYSCYKRECCSHRNRDTLLSKETKETKRKEKRQRRSKKKIINKKDNIERWKKSSSPMCDSVIRRCYTACNS